MRLRKICSVIIFLAVVICPIGCASAPWLLVGAAAGVGTYAYLDRESEQKYPVGFDAAWDAASKALEQLQFTKENSKRDGIDGVLQVRRAGGTKVTLTFKLLSEKVTSIRIGVGTFGNHDISERIHERIKENLGLK
jgi:hypothetical protein